MYARKIMRLPMCFVLILLLCRIASVFGIILRSPPNQSVNEEAYMTPSSEIEIVNESTIETQKIIHELLEVTTTQQTTIMNLSEQLDSKELPEIRSTKDKLKKEIQHERKLTRKIESILNKQSSILQLRQKFDGRDSADEIETLLASISRQNQSVQFLKTTLMSLEQRLERLEKNR